jgi:hypothetical protein
METKKGWTEVPVEIYKCKFSDHGDCLFKGKLPSGAWYSDSLRKRYCNVSASNTPDFARGRCDVAAQGDNVIKDADIVAHVSPGGAWT